MRAYPGAGRVDYELTVGAEPCAASLAGGGNFILKVSQDISYVKFGSSLLTQFMEVNRGIICRWMLLHNQYEVSMNSTSPGLVNMPC